jgi:hypothetical protein
MLRHSRPFKIWAEAPMAKMAIAKRTRMKRRLP